MDDLVPLHFFKLPWPGVMEPSSLTILNLISGKKKILLATRKGKTYLYEFLNDGNSRVPSTNEVAFSGITRETEILSINAFNRSQTSDYFCVGMIISKRRDHERRDIFFHIYQDVERAELNIDSLAQNCYLIQLSYQSTIVDHTFYPNILNMTIENVWILHGHDEGIHLYRDDENHIFQEVQSELFFPEFPTSKVVNRLDIKYTSNFERRLTALGNSDGTVQCSIISTLDGSQINYLTNDLHSPVIDVAILINRHNGIEDFNLVALTEEGATVFMDITRPVPILHKLQANGRPHSICLGDINGDLKDEILLFTWTGLLVYSYKDNYWRIACLHGIRHIFESVRCIDFTGDGKFEVIVLSRNGVSILQHRTFLQKFEDQLQALQL